MAENQLKAHIKIKWQLHVRSLCQVWRWRCAWTMTLLLVRVSLPWWRLVFSCTTRTLPSVTQGLPYSSITKYYITFPFSVYTQNHSYNVIPLSADSLQRRVWYSWRLHWESRHVSHAKCTRHRLFSQTIEKKITRTDKNFKSVFLNPTFNNLMEEIFGQTKRP